MSKQHTVGSQDGRAWGSGFFIRDDGELTLFGSITKCYGEAQSPVPPLCRPGLILGARVASFGSSPRVKSCSGMVN